MIKRTLLSAFALLLCSGLAAQNFMVIDSEKVFKASASYTAAVAEVEKLAEQAQKHIDDTYQEIEKMYNNYQTQKQTMTAATRQSWEDTIISREKEINKFQEDTFGAEGTLTKKRDELIKPVQDKIMEIVNGYAQRNGFSLVLDVASSTGVLYYAPAIDRTQQIIGLIK